jgi:hypothetical protein
MLTYADAKRLAETYVDISTRGKGTISGVTAKPCGWVFFYNSREYLETGNPRSCYAGNAPFIVDRIDGELRVTGTAEPLEVYLAAYEATLPPGRLRLAPEEPPASGGSIRSVTR